MAGRPAVNRDIAGSSPAAGARGPIEHQLVRRFLNPENRGQHSVGSLTSVRPVRLAARMRRFQCCEAGSTPARDALSVRITVCPRVEMDIMRGYEPRVGGSN